MKLTLFISSICFACTCLAQNISKVNIEAGLLINQPRVLASTTSIWNENGTMIFRPNNYPPLRTGFYVAAIYNPNPIFSHIFRYARTPFGGSHTFAVESSRANVPSILGGNHDFRFYGHQFSYEIRTNITHAIDSFIRKKPIDLNKKFTVFFGVGIGGNLISENSFSSDKSQVITPVNSNSGSGFTRSTYSSQNMPFHLNFPIELGLKYNITRRFYLTLSYVAILPNFFTAKRTQFTQSAGYIFNNQLIATGSAGGPSITHGLRIGIGLNLGIPKTPKMINPPSK